MTIDPNKYIVFRRDTFQELLRDGDPPRAFDRAEIPDAVVLRLQDVHVAGALYCYASSLLATHEILTQYLNPDEVSDQVLKEMSDLWGVHEYFLTLAEEASRKGSKNPTP